LLELVDSLKKNPNSRRHLISSWNPGELEIMALPPCHILAQFYVSKDRKLSCQMYQRSADMFLGVPFNIASYALFTHMLSQVCNYYPGELNIVLGDAHIYKNHLSQVEEQLGRKAFPAPILSLDKSITEITRFTMESVKLVNYQHHEAIKAKMAI
jgi:thymidylate synthase